MYSYNSIHKALAVGIVLAWAMYHFFSRTKNEYKYEDGKPIRTGEIVNNLNEGQWIWYHPNGNKNIIGNYHKGKREGVWTIYDSLGVLKMKSNYVNNPLNGEQIYYNQEGKEARVLIYKDDKVVEQR